MIGSCCGAEDQEKPSCLKIRNRRDALPQNAVGIDHLSQLSLEKLGVPQRGVGGLSPCSARGKEGSPLHTTASRSEMRAAAAVRACQLLGSEPDRLKLGIPLMELNPFMAAQLVLERHVHIGHTSRPPEVMAALDTRSKVPMSSTESRVVSASKSINPWTTWATHSQPAFVRECKLIWCGSSLHCWTNCCAMVRATNRRTKTTDNDASHPSSGLPQSGHPPHSVRNVGSCKTFTDTAELL